MINDKSKFLKSLSKNEFNDGLIRVGIIDETDNDRIVEMLWAYQSKNSDKSTAILLNTPVSYPHLLHCGSEVKLKYNMNTAVIDNDWACKEYKNMFADIADYEDLL